jgi:hypothetical protein
MVALLTAGATMAVDQPVTKQNWMRHPQIEAIRAIVKRVDAAVRAYRYKHEERRIKCDDGRVGNEEAVERDPSGRIRKLVRTFGSDDSAYHASEYYDEAGRLRFVFATRGAAAADSADEFRLYYSEHGKQLWRDFRQTGPGYTWIEDFPDAFVVRDADEAWRTPTTCESLH